jgi:DNA-binding transcriptional regulator YdaS (Cro superfamily)
MKRIMKAALKRAVAHEGGVASFARRHKTSYARVTHWLNRGFMPAEFVLSTEDMTGVPRHELRPDIYIKNGVPL